MHHLLFFTIPELDCNVSKRIDSQFFLFDLIHYQYYSNLISLLIHFYVMSVILLNIILAKLYFRMNNVSSYWQQRHQKTLLNFLKLFTLIALIGTLCYLTDFRQARVLQYITSKGVVFTNSRILKEQQQIQGQIKAKTQTLQSAFKRQIFNLQNKDKVFGQEEKFGVRVDVENFKQNSDYQLYKSNGILNRIQVSSPYDYANLTKTINFTEVSRNMIQSISYELIEFQQTQQSEKLEQLTMKTLMKDEKQYGSIMQMANMKNGQLLRRAQYNLAIRLNEDPKSVLLREAEYLMYDIKYNLSNIYEQLPMCIYASGYKSYLKNVYSQFFESVNRLNYTNYHIVYVDDNSPPDNIEGILQFLQNSDFRFKNKIKIINNKQHLGGLGNLYIWINKYCNEGDIVVHADSDDWFIGSQVLKVLNAVYQDPQAWYVYSKYLKKTSKRGYTNGLSLELRVPVAQYRNTILWSTSHLRTFRKTIFAKIPLSYFTQYHLDETTSMAYPAFMSLAYDTDEVYSQLELCGDQRYKHVTDYLYLYSGPGTTTYNSRGVNCFRLHETADEYKTRIKIPLKKLNSITQSAEAVQNFVPLRRTLEMLGSNYRGYSKCLEDDQKVRTVVEQHKKRRLKVQIIKSKKL